MLSVILIGLSMSCPAPEPAANLPTAIVRSARHYACEIHEAYLPYASNPKAAAAVSGPTVLDIESFTAAGKFESEDWEGPDLTNVIQMPFEAAGSADALQKDGSQGGLRDNAVFISVRSLVKTDQGYDADVVIVLSEFRGADASTCHTVFRFSYVPDGKSWKEAAAKQIEFC